MGQIQTVVTIPADPQRVWDIIVSPGSYEQWMTIHTKWKGEVPETFAPGVRAEEVVTMLGMPNTIAWTVIECREPTTLTISGAGMAGVTTTFTMSVESDGNGGATASIDAAFEGAMVTGALGMAVEKDAQANLDASLAKLAQLAG